MPSKWKSRLASAVALSGCGIMLISCSSIDSNSASSSSSPDSSSVTTPTQPIGVSNEDGQVRGKVNKDAPLYNELPDDVKASGEIKVGTNAFPPYALRTSDGKTLIGFEPDLSGALSQELGVPIRWELVEYTSLYSGLLADRYDAVWAGAALTPERIEKYNMVTEMNNSSSLLVKAGNPENIAALSDLCGQTVAVAGGTSQDKFLQKEAAKCPEGKTIDILGLEDDRAGQLQVSQGRAVALLGATPSAEYSAQTSRGSLERVVPNINPGQMGIEVAKSKTQLAQAMAKAMQRAIDEGDYNKILTQWGLSDLAATKSELVTAPQAS